MAKSAAAPMSRAELEQKIVALAWKDEAFRKAFLADPKKQFEERLGTKLPPGLTITAHAEDDSHLHFVIPARPKGNLSELSDTDLEKVAGGVDAFTTAVVVLTVVAAAGTSVATASAAQSIALATGNEGWKS